MPDVGPTYRRLVAEARAQTLALTRRSLADLDRYVASLLAALVEEADRASGANAERLAARSRAMRAFLGRVRARIEALEGDAREAAQIMGEGHATAVRTVADAAGRQIIVESMFETVPERAVEALLKRRQLAIGEGLSSYAQLFRSVAASATEGVLEEIDGALVRGVARGADSRTVALQIAEALTDGRPDLRAAVERLAPSLRRSGRTLSGRGERVIEAEDLQEARELLVRSRRIARTELLDAARAGDAEAAHLSPIVAALRWTLSGNHPPTGCECELFARVDLYGMGEGVFPTNAYPTGPHPHCGCYSRAVTRGPDEWDLPKPPASAPATLDAYPFETRSRTDDGPGLAYTEAHKARVLRSANAQLRLALRDVSVETPRAGPRAVPA